MQLNPRTQVQYLPVVQTPAAPPSPEYLLVSRSTMAQILQHIATEQNRFPARRLRQAMRIVQHLLGSQESA